MAEHDSTRERSEDVSARPASRPARRMGAREWAIAYRFREPADYGIPTLPEWSVATTEEGGVAFGDGSNEPFIRAEHPVRVRR